MQSSFTSTLNLKKRFNYGLYTYEMHLLLWNRVAIWLNYSCLCGRSIKLNNMEHEGFKQTWRKRERETVWRWMKRLGGICGGCCNDLDYLVQWKGTLNIDTRKNIEKFSRHVWKRMGHRAEIDSLLL